MLVDVDALAAWVQAGRRARILDVRWRLDETEGRPAYVAGHLPGAVYVDLERELTDPGHPERGAHPLPTPEALDAAIRSWGIDSGDVVIVYDDNDGVPASRAWWLLRARGVEVRVLDGGLRAWLAAGRTLERGDRVAAPGAFVSSGGWPRIASIDEAAEAATAGALVDVRMPHHFRGSASAGDPVSGHIPGAVNVPIVAHLTHDGRLRPAAQIRASFEAAGVRLDEPIVLTCSSGIVSAHSALALRVAGVEAAVFPGGWSQWSRTRGRPVAVGSGRWDVVTTA